MKRKGEIRMGMSNQDWIKLIGHDKLLKWITDILLTVYQVDEETGLCKGKIVPDGPMQKDWQIWEDERLCVYFDRLDDDARMWVVTIIKETDQRIPMECKYDLLNQTFRFIEEGAELRMEDIWFAGFNTISFSFRKDGDPDGSGT